MKNRATIRMGAGVYTVAVNDGHGNPITFDLNRYDKIGQRKFIFEFVKTFREAGLQAA